MKLEALVNEEDIERVKRCVSISIISVNKQIEVLELTKKLYQFGYIPQTTINHWYPERKSQCTIRYRFPGSCLAFTEACRKMNLSIVSANYYPGNPFHIIVPIFHKCFAMKYFNGRDHVYWWPLYKDANKDIHASNVFSPMRAGTKDNPRNLKPRLEFLDWCINVLKAYKSEL